jgi:hypothetical protein
MLIVLAYGHELRSTARISVLPEDPPAQTMRATLTPSADIYVYLAATAQDNIEKHAMFLVSFLVRFKWGTSRLQTRDARIAGAQ